MPALATTKDGSIRVLVADADRLNCELLAAALERTGQFTVTGAENSAQVLTALTAAEPDVAVVSLNFLGDRERVFKLLRELKTAYPQIRVVVLMDSTDKPAVVESFRAGAKGVFCRSDSFQLLCKCVQRVFEGQIWATSAEMEYALQALTETRPLRLAHSEDTIPLSKREGGNPSLGACPMQVYLDQVALPTPFNLDLLPSPKEIAGIEVYAGAATIPPQFNGFNRGCGVIIVWTRDGY